MYKVLWFDDEHKSFVSIKEDAVLKYKIKLVGFDNAEEGLYELRNNHIHYDGIILDGKFYSKPGQKGRPDESGFGKVGREISNLKNRGLVIPCFIYSGQKSFVKENNNLVDLFSDITFSDGKVFNKSDEKDFDELCNNIIIQADKLPQTKIKHNNQEVFEIFDLGYLSSDKEKDLLELLITNLPRTNNERKGMLTNIRSFVEALHSKLSAIKVLPSGLSFSHRMNHLSGNPTKSSNWKPTSIVYHTKEIRNLNEWIYYTCGEYIHHLDNEQYDGYHISNYAIESMRQGLLELILWFKKTYKQYI